LTLISYLFLLAHTNSLFVACPDAMLLFGFQKSFPIEDLRYSKRILVHASFMIEMISKALNMLGTDDAELTEFMTDLGKKHIAYGVKPEYMPMMQDSILNMLQTLLADKGFGDQEKEAWNAVLSALIADMTRVQREMEMKHLADKMVL
jgi:Globin